MRAIMKTTVMPLLAGVLVAVVPLLASAKLDGRCFEVGSAAALKAVSSDAGDSKARETGTQEQIPETEPLNAAENMLSEQSELPQSTEAVSEEPAEQAIGLTEDAAEMAETAGQIFATETAPEQVVPQAAAEPQPELSPAQGQEPVAVPEPVLEPEPAPAPAPVPAASAYGTIPFEVAAQTGTWWGIDSSDSAYWAVQENINAMRAAGGLPALSVDGGLSAIASARCQSFVEGGLFDHSGMVTTSEICAAGPLGSASAVCAAWQNSPDHYANIMEPSFTSMGIGCLFCSFEGNNFTYWVVTFQ